MSEERFSTYLCIWVKRKDFGLSVVGLMGSTTEKTVLSLFFMAIYTVDEIQKRIATIIDQGNTAPTDSSEYAWRLAFINRSYEEWASAYDWEALRKEMFLNITGVSQASISLPADFRKMAMGPINYSTGVENGEEWAEVKPNERRMHSTTDKYFFLLGSRENQIMYWNPGTLASGASILISYFSYPTSLASPANTVLVPEPEFLIERTIAYILETRSDPRYQQSESRAREKLVQMVDNEVNKGLSLYDPVRTTEEKYYGFRIGRD